MALYAEIVNGVIRQTVSDGQPVRMADGTQYPGNWPKSDIAGLTPVVMAAPPASDVTVTGSTVTLVNGVPTQELQTAPIPAATILQQQAAAALSAGLSITSTGTPAINGTYPCDNTAQARFSRVYELIQRAGGSAFPAGMTELPWALADGSIVKFASVSTFLAVEQAVGEYVLALDLIIATGSGTLPAASKQIP